MTRGVGTARFATVVLALGLGLLARGAGAQVPLPTSAPIAPPAPVASAAPLPLPARSDSAPQVAPGTSPASALPTSPPIIIEPPTGGVTIGGSQALRVMQVLGIVSITVGDPSIIDASVDQTTRIVTIVGKKIGTTTLLVRDDRGLERSVPVRVAYLAGSLATDAFVRARRVAATTCAAQPS